MTSVCLAHDGLATMPHTNLKTKNILILMPFLVKKYKLFHSDLVILNGLSNNAPYKLKN